MAPWNTSDSLLPTPSFGGLRRGRGGSGGGGGFRGRGGSHRGGSRDSWGPTEKGNNEIDHGLVEKFDGGGGSRGGSRGRGGSRDWWGPREKVNDEQKHPYVELDHQHHSLVEKFDDLEVIEETCEIAKNSGMINFDAYEDIPVEVSGENVPLPVNTFAEIDLGKILNDNITRCKYVKPTPIQRYAIPIAMDGRDLMACAQTGSGKTAAFCFPIIAGILKRGPPSRPPPYRGVGGGGGGGTAFPVALILSPTRELSSQINDEANKFAYQTGLKVVVAYGGSPIVHQLRRLERGVDILVATPGRLVDMIERGKVSLNKIKYLALDEADRMLDMGFEPQIRKIVQQSNMPKPGTRQTLLFSATFPSEIQRLASDFLSNYVFLTVGRVGSSTDLIAQKVEFVYDMDKKRHLMDLLSQKINGTDGKLGLTIVFVETKRGADDLEMWLSHNGFPATAIHGDKVQMERERALRSFKKGVTPIMVATDVAARGLDIPSVAHVVNYDLPRGIDDYVHRIGRTGRAGKSGLATAFFNEKNQAIAKALAELMEEAKQQVPSWLTQYADSYSSSSSSSYGGGGGGGYRSRGGRFGGRDYRSFDTPPPPPPPAAAAAAAYSDYATNGGSGYGNESSATASASYDTSSSAAYGGYTPGYESVVATGWD